MNQEEGVGTPITNNKWFIKQQNKQLRFVFYSSETLSPSRISLGQQQPCTRYLQGTRSHATRISSKGAANLPLQPATRLIILGNEVGTRTRSGVRVFDVVRGKQKSLTEVSVNDLNEAWNAWRYFILFERAVPLMRSTTFACGKL